MNKIKNFLCLLVICLIITALIVPVSAKTPYRDFQDRPQSFDPGNSFGFFVWHDSDGWHLRTSTPGRKHIFSGKIKTDGEYWKVRPIRTEQDDQIHQDTDHNILQFKFTSAGGVDGLDFQVRDSNYVQFELYIDGRPAKSQEISLGRYNRHPGDNTFILSWDGRERDSIRLGNKSWEGRPTAFTPGFSRGSFLWHDEDGWHLRTTAMLFDRRYTGVIKTDGEFRNVHAVGNEGSGHVRTDYQRDVIRLSFHTSRDTDGLDFRLHGASYLECHLLLDGRPIETSKIYIGRHNEHPDRNPFKIRLQ